MKAITISSVTQEDLMESLKVLYRTLPPEIVDSFHHKFVSYLGSLCEEVDVMRENSSELIRQATNTSWDTCVLACIAAEGSGEKWIDRMDRDKAEFMRRFS